MRGSIMIGAAIVAAVYGYDMLMPPDEATATVINSVSTAATKNVMQRLNDADTIRERYGSHFDQMPDYVLRDLVARYEQIAADSVLQSAVRHHSWMQIIRYATDAEFELNRRDIEARVNEETKKFEREWDEKMREALK